MDKAKKLVEMMHRYLKLSVDRGGVATRAGSDAWLIAERCRVLALSLMEGSES